MKVIQVYECDFDCGFYKKTKSSVANHELRCFRNSESRSCITCLYFDGGFEYDCLAEVEFDEGKLKTQCDKHKPKPDDLEETLNILEDQGHIKIIRI